MSRVLNLLVTHQSPAAVARMLAWWRDYCSPDNMLLAFNGDESVFQQIEHPHKIRVVDPRLQTRQHQRERQSYTAIFRETSRWLAGRDYTHIHFVEYDQIPLVPDLNARQLARLEEERADVLTFELARVDGTSQPHYLYHAGLPGFADFWRTISVRADQTTVLSMFGSGSFWTRAAFDAVAALEEPFPVYLELWLPTAAHHLGYRLRDWREQGRFISSLGDFGHRFDEARQAGGLDDPSGQAFVDRVAARAYQKIPSS